MGLKKLTTTQTELLNHIKTVRKENNIFEYDEMKELSKDKFKSFDSTFNALLFKGHIKHCSTQTNRNTFITNSKF